MPVMHVFYLKNVRTGLYHASASYGGRWGTVAQLWTRRRDAEYRRNDLLRRPYYVKEKNYKADDLVILETDVVLE